MINFRFHLASLVAIFLALALGVVVGAGVIDRGVVDTLNNRLDSVERKSERIQGENGVLRGENTELTDSIDKLECHAVSDRLLGEDVAILAVRGVDGEAVQQTAATAACGGANVTGVLWLEGKWAIANEDDAAAMAEALGTASKRPATVRAAAWRQLAERLETPPTEGSEDLLGTLSDAGFVSLESADDTGLPLAQFPARGATVLLVVGGDADVPDKDVVLPAASALNAAGIPLVIGDVYVSGDDRPDRGSSLAPVRDGDLATKVSTVDDLDRPEGAVTAALALAALRQVPPLVDHYGLSTDKLMPEPAR
jgi:hypothetical protein